MSQPRSSELGGRGVASRLRRPALEPISRDDYSGFLRRGETY